jgi:hypothetical protein
MSDSKGDNPDDGLGEKKTGPKDSQKAIRQNLNNFLNPGLPIKPQAEEPNAALKLRMAQMELANRMRLGQQNKGADKKPTPPSKLPIQRTPPPGGFGSAQGVFHMKAANFGQNKPSVSKRSPYQQIFAAASKPPEEEKEPAPSADPTQEVPPSDGGEVLEVPADAEVKQDQKKPKRLRGKKFRNPSL